MMILSKDQILSGLKALPTQTVPVPELGGDVLVRTLSGAERDEWEASCFGGEKGKLNLANVRARFVALTVVDEQGNRLFNELDAQILGRGNGAALDRIFDAAQKLNGLRKKDIEDLAKNSGTGLSAGSGSDSQPISDAA